MSTYIIVIVTVLYFGVAFSFFKEGNLGLAICYAAYAVANIGLIMAGQKI